MREVKRPVTITFDGESIQAEDGEPIAAALLAAGKLQVARSPKYHRPRGPACFRGACDGCLARVDGEPNVMTCLSRAHEGCTIESQNTLGARELDLLRVTDWFFPEGFNHHELFAGVPGVEKVMQVFARRVAGLGKIPEEARAPRKAVRRELDVLIVGGGLAGILAAMELSQSREVVVIDDALEIGGTALLVAEDLVRAFAKNDRVQKKSGVTCGIFGDDVLCVLEDETWIARAKTVILAPGAHDGALAFEGNDLPGILSARAGAMLARRGIQIGKKALRLVTETSRFEIPYAKTVQGTPTEAKGSSRIKGVVVDGKTWDCDVLFLDAPPAPAYELCAQAGAKLRHEPRGFVVEQTKIREGFYAIGEVTGVPLDVAKMKQHVISSVGRA